MNLKLQSIHFDADRKLVSFIQGKIEKLSRFYEGIVDGEVVLRLDNHKNLENKVILIKVNVPGGEFVAKENRKTFEEATTHAVENLSNQIKKHKEKIKG
jgi:putative sigma-54 modulation protein